MLKIIDGGGSTVSTNGGKVTLNLRSLVGQVAAQIGILLVIAAVLAGSTRYAVRLRELAAPYLRDLPGYTYAAAAAVYLALIASASIAAFRKPLRILAFALLMVLGTELLGVRRPANSPRTPTQNRRQPRHTRDRAARPELHHRWGMMTCVEPRIALAVRG